MQQIKPLDITIQSRPLGAIFFSQIKLFEKLFNILKILIC